MRGANSTGGPSSCPIINILVGFFYRLSLGGPFITCLFSAPLEPSRAIIDLGAWSWGTRSFSESCPVLHPSPPGSLPSATVQLAPQSRKESPSRLESSPLPRHPDSQLSPRGYLP